MPGVGQTERGSNMTGLYQGMAQRERAHKRIFVAETGSAHVLCPCSYRGTSQICVIAGTQSVFGKVALFWLGALQPLNLVGKFQNNEFRVKRRFTEKSRLTTADTHPSK